MTDRRRLCPGGDVRQCLLLQARYAIEAGIDVLQVRERDLESAPLVRIVADIVRLAEGSRTQVIVNDRVDVAMAAGAGGVHLRRDSLPARAVRAVAPPPFLIGQSIHSAAEAAALTGPVDDVDYVILGTIWETRSKAPGHPALGVEALAEVVRTTSLPVFAIGGVTPERLRLVAETGAAGVAAVGLFFASSAASGGAACRAMPLDGIVKAAREARKVW